MDTFHFYKNDQDKQKNKILDNFHTKLNERIGAEDLEILIKQLRKSPSNPMRAYIFGYIIPSINKIFLEYGNEFTDMEVYEFMKDRGKFYNLMKIRINNNTTTRKRYDTFSNLGNKKRTAAFIDFCIRWSSEHLGLSLESPEEYKLKRGIRNENTRNFKK